MQVNYDNFAHYLNFQVIKLTLYKTRNRGPWADFQLLTAFYLKLYNLKVRSRINNISEEII